MARYRRNFIAGGTFFSPSNSPTQNHACLSNTSASRTAYMDVQKRYPFETVAVCVLPNHIHAIWTLPPDDADYSLRWRLIKTKFSAHFPRAENLSASKQRRHERGIWQRRFYEHTVRDENGFATLRGLHPFQSRQTWIVRRCPRLGVFIVSPLCAGRMAAIGLGRYKRNGGNEFWRVNAIIKNYRPRAWLRHTPYPLIMRNFKTNA